MILHKEKIINRLENSLGARKVASPSIIYRENKDKRSYHDFLCFSGILRSTYKQQEQQSNIAKQWLFMHQCKLDLPI